MLAARYLCDNETLKRKETFGLGIHELAVVTADPASP